MWPIIKVLITAVLIVIISEISSKFQWIGSILAALPLTSVLAMIWMHYEGSSTAEIAAFSKGVFWMVLPSLPMFLLLPRLMEKLGFPLALVVGGSLTAGLYFLMRVVLLKFQIMV